MTKSLLHIDLDGIVYRMCFFGEANVPQACAIVVDRLISKLKADDAKCYLSCKTADGYRRHINPTYKSNRTGKVLPYADSLRDAHYSVRNNPYFNTIEVDGLEADDLCGIYATTPDKNDNIIVSYDKDLRSVPGKLYNPKTRVLTCTTQAEADRLFWTQVLSGDSCDGYKGCKRIGVVGAAKMLEDADPEEYGAIVRKAYKDAGHTQEYLLQQATCARILRYTDYDIASKTFNYNYLYA